MSKSTNKFNKHTSFKGFIDPGRSLPWGWNFLIFGPDPDPDPDPEPKFIEKTDPINGKKLQIPVELDSYLGHVITKTRTTIEAQYKPLLEKLQEEKAELGDIRVEYDKLKEVNMTAEERAQEKARKVIQDNEKIVKKALAEKDTWKERFETVTKRNDILSSFGDTKLCNPSQVATLLENEGRAKISEITDDEGKSTGDFETRITVTLEDDNGAPQTMEGTPAELFKPWIALERNLHHVQNELGPGGGTKRNQLGGKGKQDLSHLLPVERINASREQKQ